MLKILRDNSPSLPISRIFKLLSDTAPFARVWDWFKAYKNAIYFNPRNYPKHFCLTQGKRVSDALYIIVSGTVDFIHSSTNNQKKSINIKSSAIRGIKVAICGEYSCLGLSAIFDELDHEDFKDDPRYKNDYAEFCSAVCSTNVTVLELNRKFMKKCIQKNCLEALRLHHRDRGEFQRSRLDKLQSKPDGKVEAVLKVWKNFLMRFAPKLVQCTTNVIQTIQKSWYVRYCPR